MTYGNPPNGPYGGQDPYGSGQYPQQGGQYPQKGGQYPQQGGQYPQQGGQYPQYDPYQQPGATPSYNDPYQQQPGAYDPYQQPGSGQWGQQPGQYGPPPSGGGNKLPIIAAIVVAVLVLSGVGVWLVVRGTGDSDTTATETSSSSTRNTTSRTRTTTSRPSSTTTRPSTSAAGDPAAESELISVLPQGFSSSNCRGVPPAGGALAQVQCDQNTEPGGPTSATFTIWPDQASLDRAFNSSDPVAQTGQLRDCPDDVSSPSSWTYNSDPDVTAGYVACGMSPDNTPQITWSKYRDFTMGYAVGPDLDSLHNWWWEFG